MVSWETSVFCNRSLDICMHVCDYKLDRNNSICRKRGFRSFHSESKVRAHTNFEREYIANLEVLNEKLSAAIALQEYIGVQKNNFIF